MVEQSQPRGPVRSRLVVTLAVALVAVSAALLMAGPVSWALESRDDAPPPDNRPRAELVAEKERARIPVQGIERQELFSLDAPGDAAPGAFWTALGLIAGGVLYLAAAGALWRGPTGWPVQVLVSAVGGTLAITWVVAGIVLLGFAFSPNWGA
ncbi:MAG: hypothetical protein HY875_16255 [Chloroflexi bacterium]|nr:hypothetical protein [Chloroflexota bacterium]